MCFRSKVGLRPHRRSLREAVARWDLTPVCAGVVNEQGVAVFNFLKRRRDPLRWRPTRQDRWLMRAAAAGVAAMALVLGIQWIHERYAVAADSAELHAQATQLLAERATLVRATSAATAGP